jgi:hypothetical protein
MKQTIQERYFTYFIMTLVVLVMLFVVMPAKADECVGAHNVACEDRIGAEVTFERIGSTQFIDICGFDVDACAVLNVTKKQCTIYYRTRYLEDYIVEHELNHCRGWFHIGDHSKAYKKPWVDLDTYLGR